MSCIPSFHILNIVCKLFQVYYCFKQVKIAQVGREKERKRSVHFVACFPLFAQNTQDQTRWMIKINVVMIHDSYEGDFIEEGKEKHQI